MKRIRNLSKEELLYLKRAVDRLLTVDVDYKIESIRLAEYCVDENSMLTGEVDVYVDLLTADDDVDDILECECLIESMSRNLHFIETYPNEDRPPHYAVIWERKSGYVI